MDEDTINIELIQGEDFELDITWEDEEGNSVDVTGYTAKIQFRKNPGDATIYVEASTTNGKIIIDTVNNLLKINIPASEINQLKFNYAEADLFVTSPTGKPYKLFNVKAELIKRVTV